MAEKKIHFAPGQTYLFDVSVGNKNLSDDLDSVRIISSLSSAYQAVILTFFLETNSIILDEFFGQNPIKMYVYNKGQTGSGFGIVSEKDTVFMDLLYVKSITDLPMKSLVNPNSKNNPGSKLDRSPVSIITVCREAFRTITTTVNDVFLNKTAKEIIVDLVSDYTNASLVYDTSDENTNSLDQIVIPPTTLYKAVEYLNSTFGLFDGIPSIFCDYNNKIHVRNLSARMRSNQTFTMYHLSTNVNQRKIIESTTDGKTFYTYDNIRDNYSGNSKIAVLSKSSNFIVKPSDTLYHVIQKDMVQDICRNAGLVYNNPKTFYDTYLDERVRYYTDHTGYEKTESFAISEMAKKISQLSTISFKIERNFNVLPLMNVGEPVKFLVGTVEDVPISGKYILKATDLVFQRSANWQAVATINLIRTNKVI